MAEITIVGLRVVLEVAESGSFTAAARRLGYSQSAVSRQVAQLERAVGETLFDRQRGGVRLTAAGSRLVERARRITAEVDHALADAGGRLAGPVRLGGFPTALATLVPDALTLLREEAPGLVVTVREATTPALARALRAGTIDLAIVAQAPPFRPIDAGSPAMDVSVLAERDLLVAVGPGHPLSGRAAVEPEELLGQVWVTSPTDGDALLGVWPDLSERSDVRFVVRDWFAKLRLVAAGAAITTITSGLAAHLPAGVTAVAVRGEPAETRRLSVAVLPGTARPEVAVVVDALRRTLAGSAFDPS